MEGSHFQAVRGAIGEHALPSLHDLVLGNVAGRSAPGQVTAFLDNWKRDNMTLTVKVDPLAWLDVGGSNRNVPAAAPP